MTIIPQSISAVAPSTARNLENIADVYLLFSELAAGQKIDFVVCRDDLIKLFHINEVHAKVVMSNEFGVEPILGFDLDESILEEDKDYGVQRTAEDMPVGEQATI